MAYCTAEDSVTYVQYKVVYHPSYPTNVCVLVNEVCTCSVQYPQQLTPGVAQHVSEGLHSYRREGVDVELHFRGLTV
jgi:hypothetical protein